MSELISLFLAAFGVWRVAHLAAIEDGPFDLFARWREWLGQATWIGRGFHCPACISFWLAALPGAILSRSAADFIVIWLGLAGLALALHKVLGT